MDDNRQSLRFRDISDNTFKIAMRLTQNQKLKRYLKYLDNDPLSPDKPDIEDSLIDDGGENDDGNIFLTPLGETITMENRAMLFINPFRGTFFKNEKNILDTNTYVIDIVMANKFWMIRGTGVYRAFAIANEIARELDQQHIAGIGEAVMTSWKTSTAATKGISVLTIWLDIKNTAIRGSYGQ